MSDLISLSEYQKNFFDNPNKKLIGTPSAVTKGGVTYLKMIYEEKISPLMRVINIVGAFALTVFTYFIALLFPTVRKMWADGLNGTKTIKIKINGNEIAERLRRESLFGTPHTPQNPFFNSSPFRQGGSPFTPEFSPFDSPFRQPGPSPFFNSNPQPRTTPFPSFFGASYYANFADFFDTDSEAAQLEEKKKHYATLGLPDQSSTEEVKTAYKKLSLQYHPDRIKKQDDEAENTFQARRLAAEEMFKKISGAYEGLTKES